MDLKPKIIETKLRIKETYSFLSKQSTDISLEAIEQYLVQNIMDIKKMKLLTCLNWMIKEK